MEVKLVMYDNKDNSDIYFWSRQFSLCDNFTAKISHLDMHSVITSYFFYLLYLLQMAVSTDIYKCSFIFALIKYF